LFYLTRQRHKCHNFQYFEQNIETLALILVEMETGPDRQTVDVDADPEK
jgi:hypothetical protein